MESIPLLDRAGQRRSPATTSKSTKVSRRTTKCFGYPPDPPSVEEIIAVMRAAGDRPEGVRLRGVVVVLWRAGVRISEALALRRRICSYPIRHGRRSPDRDDNAGTYRSHTRPVEHGRAGSTMIAHVAKKTLARSVKISADERAGWSSERPRANGAAPRAVDVVRPVPRSRSLGSAVLLALEPFRHKRQ